MYDPITDLWSQKASLPKTIVQSDPYVYSAVVDNQIIVITSDEDLEVLIYDPNTDVWRKGKTSGYDSGFAIAVAVATSGRFAPQKIYILSSGPSIYFMPTGYVGVYDPLSGMWGQPKEDPIPRAYFGVAVLDDVLYVIGGTLLVGTEGQRETSPINEQYVPLGYNPQNYPNTQPSATAPPTTAPATSDTTSSPTNSFGSFLTRSTVVAVIVLMACVVVVTLFFYLRKKTGAVE
jgi:hypothetical protein